MLRKQYETVWNQLRSKKAHMPKYLDSVRVSGIHGIKDLLVPFPYPVSVLAGPNGCGKSTVLFAVAAAYPNQDGVRRFPSDLFPNFRSKSGGVSSDNVSESSIGFVLKDGLETVQYMWSRRIDGRWKRRTGRAAPERVCYIRTLADLTNPSEIRSVLQMGRRQVSEKEVSAGLVAFAMRILGGGFRYASLAELSDERRNLLFANLESGGGYSEFHMASGERMVLRLSREISELKDALVLIDEIEVGLHPFTQQHLMLELQRLALRNNLQILVNTHSPVILESVPEEGRIFLERDGDNVVIRPGWRDVLQRAMYGRPLDRLHVLCEDGVARAVVQGVMDNLGPAIGLTNADIDIGHDTGKDEFKGHIRALARFEQLDSFVFVLDGDGVDLEPELKAAAAGTRQNASILILPGQTRPEDWIWQCMEKDTLRYADVLKIDSSVLAREMDQIGRIFEAATNSKPADKAKERFRTLVEGLGRDPEDIARLVACSESAESGSLIDFRTKLQEFIYRWRSLEG